MVKWPSGCADALAGRTTNNPRQSHQARNLDIEALHGRVVCLQRTTSPAGCKSKSSALPLLAHLSQSVEHSAMKILRSYLSGALALVLVVAAVTVYFTTAARSSDHQDSPTVVSNPMEDITDVFAFPAPDQPGNVVFVVDFYPLIPAGQTSGVSFDPNVLYQIKIANAANDPSEHVVIQMKANAAGPA